MMKNRLFLPQEALDSWLIEGVAEMRGQEMLLRNDGTLYRLAEAVRVLREVTGEQDASEIVGRCKTRAYLKELGADIVGGSMVIENNAYDVISGFICTPATGASLPPARAPLTSEEILLAQFLAEKM